MKILAPVVACLAAATLCLNAQTHGTSTTTTTTLTTPPGTLTTPGTTVTTPSTTVVTPAPAETSEPGSATVTTSPATVTTPPATTPPATATAPSVTVTTAPEPATTTAAAPPPGRQIAGYIAQEDQWIEAPAGLPGAQMMVLHGDINKPGPYTIRLRLPAGYRVPIHWNDNEVNLTVISGTLHIGFAPNFDATNSKEIGALSFATLPARMKHTEWTDTDTIVQVHGLGPWTMHQVYPSATVRAP